MQLKSSDGQMLLVTNNEPNRIIVIDAVIVEFVPKVGAMVCRHCGRTLRRWSLETPKFLP